MSAGGPWTPPRRNFLDLDFDQVSLNEVLAWIGGRGADAPFAYVVTPNVDHMVRLERLSSDLRRTYEQADLCLCDSRILARIAGPLGVKLTVVPGSDLTAALFERGLKAGDTVCLIGGSARHKQGLEARYPGIEIVQHEPPMGLLHNAEARAAAVTAAAKAKAAVTLIAVGSPQQELIAYEMRRSGKVGGTALCIGASVDFLIGAEQRAPRAVSKLGLEWAWRLALNPRRLARRYLVDCPPIFPMAWRWARRRRR